MILKVYSNPNYFNYFNNFNYFNLWNYTSWGAFYEVREPGKIAIHMSFPFKTVHTPWNKTSIGSSKQVLEDIQQTLKCQQEVLNIY